MTPSSFSVDTKTGTASPVVSALLDHAYSHEAIRAMGLQVVEGICRTFEQSLNAPETQQVFPYLPQKDQLEVWRMMEGVMGTVGFEELLAKTLADSTHLHHPRNMGHQVGVVLPMAVWCEAVSAYLNNGTGVYEMGPASTMMELHVLGWLCRKLGYPEGSGGFLTSGGSLGNLTALLTMRQVMVNRHFGVDYWKDGATAVPPLAVLASETVHYSLSRVIRMLGWGEAGLIAVPVDAGQRLKAEALPEALEKAKAQGRHVIGVIGNGCCTATGAFDPLPAMADFCEAHGLWLHVDGAHGASAVLSEKYKPLARGMERADSVIWDAHKMMMMPALVTAVLYKEAAHQYQTFAQEASYLFAADDPRAMDEPYNLAHRSLECTKKMMGFKLYATLMCYGEGIFEDYLDRTFDLAHCLFGKLQAHPQFEPLMAPETNIVCFRLIQPELSPEALDALQARVRQALVRSGEFYLVQTQLNGRLYLRTTLMNPFTRPEDFDALLERLLQLGRAHLSCQD